MVEERDCERSAVSLGLFFIAERVAMVCRDFIRELRNAGYDCETVHEAAVKVLECFEILETPVPIIRIVQEFGFQVYQCEMEDQMSGFVAVDSKWVGKFGADKLIVVNSERNLGHKRFMIAQGLGQFLADYEEDGEPYYSVCYRNAVESLGEKCASRFAANLLMPRMQFIDAYNNLRNASGNLIANLAYEFKVPARAVEMRMEELSLAALFYCSQKEVDVVE